MPRLLENLEKIISSFSLNECEFFPSYPLSRLTTLRIGGKALYLAVPKTEAAFLLLLSRLGEEGIPRYIMGNGSNLLAPDEGYHGVVIRTTALRDIRVEGTVIYAQCGARLSAIAQAAAEQGIGGFAPLAGIPATLGGALFTNAGAFGTDIGARVLQVRAAPPCGASVFYLAQEECHFGYRKSIFTSRGLLSLSCALGGYPSTPASIREEMKAYLSRRRQTQPLDLPSAGSVFRRPIGDYAGRLIEEAGLKGARCGGAMVSPKHAGFIVNTGGATAADFKALTEHIRDVVAERFGILLVREIEYLGEE